ncbi:ribose 5-phosphate isomerase A [uncultured Faecalibaculum sp.]|uniref:ribose 5-phosphate isomerase A n=1 Tax=uncultured Faecalibaculum sp. TaxID=1729681 RepID=UPI00262035E5|nr:ribose 5-phosphate isomerase A [uncultured Faecalibaculum sp.]
MRRECAEAAYKMIRSGMTIGLGGGRTIQYLIEFINMGNLENIKVVTPSMATALACKSHGITVVPTWLTSSLDIAFDGCDQVDASLNTQKTAGAIHTQERIVAAMAKEYVVLVDSSKLVQKLTFEYPVAVEVIPEAFSFVKARLEQMGAQVAWRTGTGKDGGVMTDQGNPILDAAFSSVQDPAALNESISSIPGVVDTSLFVDVVTRAVVAQPDGSVQIIDRP